MATITRTGVPNYAELQQGVLQQKWVYLLLHRRQTIQAQRPYEIGCRGSAKTIQIITIY